MKHKKTAAFLFAVTLGLTALTACTEQPDSKETASTAAESSVVSTEEESCCHKESSVPDCCKNEESSKIPDCCGG